MAIAILGLGSNQGNPKENLDKAVVAFLQRFSVLRLAHQQPLDISGNASHFSRVFYHKPSFDQ